MSVSVKVRTKVLNLGVRLEQVAHLIGDAHERFNLRNAQATWALFRSTHGFKRSATKLLTYPDAQLKLGKSKEFTVGLTLQHADVSGVETCAWRGECTKVCVLDNGNGRYANTQKGRDVKTKFLNQYPELFAVLLIDELRSLAQKYDRVLVRLNVNSDIRWYRIFVDLTNGKVPGLRNVFFYDYTKNPAILSGNGKVAKNYRMAYSVNENSDLDKVRAFVARGGTAAIVTSRKKSDAPPKRFMGLRVVDGDATDNRYDERGVWVDLSAKGKARALIGVNDFVRSI